MQLVVAPEEDKSPKANILAPEGILSEFKISLSVSLRNCPFVNSRY